MNNRRNSLYIPLILILIGEILAMLLSIAFALNNYRSALHDKGVIVSFYIFIGLIIAASIYSFTIIHLVKNNYIQQYKEYNKAIIIGNLKRETSALIVVSSFLPAILSLFIIVNTYVKSGLSMKRNRYAKRQIRIKAVPLFLKQKKVVEGLKKKHDALRMINNAIKFKDNKIDSAYNCHLFIIQILDKENIEFKIEYKENEIYEIGMSM